MRKESVRMRDIISSEHPELKKKYNSKQYFLSEELMRLKLKNKLSQLEMASFLGISLDKYLSIEAGSLEISVEEYESLLKTLED